MAAVKFRKGSTLSEAGLTATAAKKLLEAGKIKVVGQRKTGKRGRPANEFQIVR